jgi:hypothetical protein
MDEEDRRHTILYGGVVLAEPISNYATERDERLDEWLCRASIKDGTRCMKQGVHRQGHYLYCSEHHINK